MMLYVAVLLTIFVIIFSLFLFRERKEKCLPIYADRVAFISNHSSTLEEQDVEREIGW